MFIYIALFSLASIVSCEAAYVDNIKKCSIDSESCLKTLFQGLYGLTAPTGISELGIPALEPFVIKNDTIVFGEGLLFTLDKSTVHGLKDCVYEKYQISTKKGIMSHRMTCKSVKVYAEFTLSGTNALLQSFLGGKTIGGHGIGTIEVDKVSFHFDIPFKVVKNDDGVIYLSFDQKQNKHGHEIGDVKIDVKKFIIGKQDLSTIMDQIMKENARLFVDQFDKEIIEKVLDYYISFQVKSLYDRTPAEVFFTDDLSIYVKN